MPVVLLERVPLPSLRSYTSVSVLLLACAVYYAHQVLTGAVELEISDENETESVLMNVLNSSKNVSLEEYGYVMGTAHVIAHTTWCVWVMVNMAYCCLILFGKMIQHAAFGELRVSEQQHIKDKFWNFVFYKFIFIFGVMNVQDMGEVILWCAWFSVLGFLHLLAQLCKDRFEYLSFSPTISSYTHLKVVTLLALILSVSGLLFAGCIVICYFYATLNTFAFMAAECILLMNRTLYVIVRYGIHLWDLNHDGVWENRALYVYYSELVFELAGLSVDFVHHLHMLVWGNIFLSMASLVICMQLRYLFHEFQRRIRRHKNYLRVVNSMEAKFPMATKEELQENNDDCAICWEKMESGRKLPCGHFYHNACLRSWLEQDTSCPTCRTNLGEPSSSLHHHHHHHPHDPQQPQQQIPLPTVPPPPTQPAPAQPNRTFNHFFHFDGSRYVSWLPSFSVEVTHTELLVGAGGRAGVSAGGQRQRGVVVTSQLEHMARQVQEVFPAMPLPALLDDLRVTRSVEGTIENVIEGRLQPPPPHMLRPPSPTSSTDSINSTSSNSDATPPPSLFLQAPPPDPDLTNQRPGPGGDGPETDRHQQENALNFFMEENIQDPSTYEEARETDGEIPSTSGSRFSKSSSEREQMLGSRKESLLEAARRRYLEIQSPSSQGDISESEEDHPITQYTDSPMQHHSHQPHTRELAFQAAQRRLQNNTGEQ